MVFRPLLVAAAMAGCAAPQWTAHKDPRGFSLDAPPGWEVAPEDPRVTANTSRIVSRTNAQISDMISESYEHRQAVMDELSRRSNAILGVEDVVDATTGESYRVESGSNYYWVDNRGAIADTHTYTRPNLDFRDLVRLP